MKFIINADDFGISTHVNNAIYENINKGFVSSTTMMAVAPYIEEAAEMAQELHNISLGVHLVFDGDFNSLAGIPENFSFNNEVNLKRLNLKKVSILVDEFSKQIEKLQKLGIKVSHIDTHHHLHLYPLVLLATIKVAKKFGIKKIRSQKLLASRSFINNTYRGLHHYLTEKSALIQPSFYTDFPTLSDIGIDTLAENSVCEIMCHPGSKYNDEAYFTDAFYSMFDKQIISYNQLN